jgi:hypothetical protein
MLHKSENKIVKSASSQIYSIQLAYIYTCVLDKYLYVWWLSVRRTETCSIIDKIKSYYVRR